MFGVASWFLRLVFCLCFSELTFFFCDMLLLQELCLLLAFFIFSSMWFGLGVMLGMPP